MYILMVYRIFFLYIPPFFFRAIVCESVIFKHVVILKCMRKSEVIIITLYRSFLYLYLGIFKVNGYEKSYI